MDKDYKVETKPTMFEVTLSHGCYSSYIEKHLFFAANDEEEVWHFLCRYLESVNEEDDGKHYCDASFYECISFCGLVWNDKKYRSKKCTEEEDRWFETDYGGGLDVEIHPLNVIYFKN